MVKETQDRRTFGVLIDRFEHRYQFVLARRLSELARERNFNLIFYSGFPLESPLVEESQFNLVYDLVNVNYLDGLIVSSGSLSHYVSPEKMIAFCRRFGKIPMVSLAMEIPGVPSILMDNRDGMRKATEHLIRDHGMKRVAMLRGPLGHPEAEARYQGYLDALKAFGLSGGPEMEFFGDFNRHDDPEGFVRALRECRFDALVSVNDEMASDTVRISREAGFDVPRDFRMVSFDNLEMSIYQEPSLSSVNQPLELLAERAVDTLLSIVRHEDYPLLQTLELDFFNRESCGCDVSHDRFDELKERYFSLRRYYKANDKIMMWWRNFSQDMSSVTDYGEMVERLSKNLDFIGIPETHICLFQWPVLGNEAFIPRYSQMVMSRKHSKNLISGEPETFITEKLLPEGVLRDDEPRSIVVMPLVRLETHYGYVAMGIGDHQPSVYGTLREQLCNTIQTIRMLAERAETLDKLKQSLEEQKLQEARFREMVTELPSILLELDERGRIVYMNQAACAALSEFTQTPEGPVSFTEILSPNDRARFEEFRRAVLEGDSSKIMEFRIEKQESKEPWIAMAAKMEDQSRSGGIRISALNLFSLFLPGSRVDEQMIAQYHLSAREKEVFRYVISGTRYKEIAEKLFIAECTVKDHVKSIYNKMGVNNKQEFFSRFKPLMGSSGPSGDLFLQLLRYFLND